MTKDFKRFYVSRAMFLGTSMFLASIGIASANPSTGTLSSAELSPVVASPQQAKYTIKGIVEDEFGPVAGANVVEKGTTNGTVTDMDGKFSINASSDNAIFGRVIHRLCRSAICSEKPEKMEYCFKSKI